MNEFLKATAVRCARSFLLFVTGYWTAGTLITELDWKEMLLGAVSATIYTAVICGLAGLPEVESASEVEFDENDDAPKFYDGNFYDDYDDLFVDDTIDESEEQS